MSVAFLSSLFDSIAMGADDYITKPFKLNELLSRIKAILRRSLQFSKADTLLEANGVRVDTAERLVWKNDKPLDLPLVEYKLLCLFMQNPNHLMPREMILDRMWDVPSFFGVERSQNNNCVSLSA